MKSDWPLLSVDTSAITVLFLVARGLILGFWGWGFQLMVFGVRLAKIDLVTIFDCDY